MSLNAVRASGATSTPVVKTTTGDVQGFVDGDTGQSCFWGIPYAETPTGELRFKPPVAKKKWNGVYSATAFGPAGPQVFDTTEGSYEEFTGKATNESGNPWIGSEDNLVLNVWTPQADNKKRPVMVWIHGGANWLESSRLATYHGDKFVERGDVVFVSINYRLGVFGWLDVTSLCGEDYAGSHSNGLRDQTMALQWIKANIESFGGDPENITVMGESAGSIDLSWLLVNGHLDGIAKRVVLMSGIAGLLGLSGDLTHGMSDKFGRETGADFLARMGIKSKDELLAASTDDLMARVSDIFATTETLFVLDSQFWPRESAFTPIDPLRGAAQCGSRGIDVIVGYTDYEMGLWLFWDDKLDTHDCGWAAKRMLYPHDASGASSVYEQQFPEDSAGVHAMHFIGDSIFVMPSYWFADALARKGENVWMFQFDWEANERQRALHAADQAFLFGKLNTHAAEHLIGTPRDAQDRKQREDLSRFMMDAVLEYARAGAPPHAWQKYDANTRQVMSFDVSSRMVADPAAVRRNWWYNHIYEPALASGQ